MNNQGINKIDNIVLGSASPRRKELLEQMGLSPKIMAADIDESQREKEAPKEYVARMAASKCQAVLSQTQKGDVVICSDTVVVLNDKIFQKPIDFDDFKNTMLSLSNNTHQVMTAVTIHSALSHQTLITVTDVSFIKLSDQQIKAYWQSGEPHDKAGGYGIQGLGAVFVDHINGSYSNVVGLPISQTAAQLTLHGIDLLAATLKD